MPNIASALKDEIARVARKEIKSEVTALKKVSAQHRAHIAALRRQVETLERALKKVAKASRTAPAVAGDEESGTNLRFSAKGFARHRERLKLSAADYGRLMGVSGQSVYKWESGEVRPRRSQLEQIARVRKWGRREALRLLADSK